jgi:hypothetical protein
LKQSARPGTRFEDEPEHEAFWDQTIRPSAFATAGTTPSRNSPHSRESSGDRTIHSPSAIPSPRGHPQRQVLGGATERSADYSKSAAVYGHHRQASIVHGFQHSRDGSLSSMSTGVWSPQMIATAGVGLDRSDMQSVAARLDMEANVPARPGTSLAGPTLSPVGALPMERSASAADASAPGSTPRNLERMQSKSRRDHSAHQSQSRLHRDDQKTVGEYALHVLFTSVSETVAHGPGLYGSS